MILEEVSAEEILERPEVEAYCARVSNALAEVINAASDEDMRIAGAVQAVQSAILILAAIGGVDCAKEVATEMADDLKEEMITGLIDRVN